MKKIKAYAVIVFDDFISNAQTIDGFAARAVFFDGSEARRFKERYDQSEGYDKSHKPKVVKCTITYELPTKPRTKAKRTANQITT